jgi:hypothetical protein
MSEEMKKNISDEELNKEQIDEVAGGILPPPSHIPTCSQCGSPMTRGNGVMYYCPNGCRPTPPPIAGSTKKVTCKKCGATIDVPAICMAGPVKCTACGEWFTA